MIKLLILIYLIGVFLSFQLLCWMRERGMQVMDENRDMDYASKGLLFWMSLTWPIGVIVMSIGFFTKK